MSRALGTDIRDQQSIRGISGIDHQVQAISVDDKNKRIVVFSSEANPRVAALMQVDIQGAMPGSKILVARPIIFDLGVISRQIFSSFGTSNFVMSELASRINQLNAVEKTDEEKLEIVNMINPYILPISTVFDNISVPAVTQVVDIIQQLSNLDWESIFKNAKENPATLMISINKLLSLDNLENDRNHGICPLPLYEFNEGDWELFSSGRRIGEVRERLKELDIYQYFFPPPDHLALGAVEHGIGKNSDIVEAVKIAPELGHMLGEAELMPSSRTLPEMLEQLADLGYVAEGEYGLTTTSKGTSARSTIKFRPREGIFAKIINRFSAKVNVSLSPKDLI